MESVALFFIGLGLSVEELGYYSNTFPSCRGIKSDFRHINSLKRAVRGQ
jgi:hypothetical protein